MNLLKIQQDVLKALLLQKPVKYYPAADTTFLSIDGALGWFIPDNRQMLKLAGAQIMTPLSDYVTDPDPEHQLIGTDTYRVGGSARAYIRRDGLTVYVDTAKLKYFEHPTLYQKGGPLSVITVAEDVFDTGEYTVAGIVAPMKVEPEDDED